MGVAYSPDGHTFATAGITARRLGRDDRQTYDRGDADDWKTFCMAYSPDGR